MSNLIKSQGKFKQSIQKVGSILVLTNQLIPDDDTLPEIAEGAEIISQEITPKSTLSTFIITCNVNIATGTAARLGIVAVFYEYVGVPAYTCIGVSAQYMATANKMYNISIVCEPLSRNHLYPNTPRRISVRVGSDANTILTVGGSGGLSKFDGRAKPRLIIQEVI